MSTKYKNGLTEFIYEVFGNIANAASALEVVPQTLYSQAKHPSGGYKVLAIAWNKYKAEKERADALQESYATLANRYNALVKEINGENDKIKEYFGK